MGKLTFVGAAAVAVAVFVLGGCYHADVEIPSYIGVGGPPPPAQITPADPHNKVDLLRENQQLQDRVAYLEEQNRKLANKSADQQRETAKIQSQINEINRQRDQYRRALGQ